MVRQVSSFARTGVFDWLVQRVTAVIVAIYSVVLVAYLLLQPELTYQQWSGLFSRTWIQVFTLMTVIATCAHAWIGMWTIGTDYLRVHTIGERADALRLTYQLGCLLVLVIYLIWGIKILWGN